jgi:hypothetical protein
LFGAGRRKHSQDRKHCYSGYVRYSRPPLCWPGASKPAAREVGRVQVGWRRLEPPLGRSDLASPPSFAAFPLLDPSCLHPLTLCHSSTLICPRAQLTYPSLSSRVRPPTCFRLLKRRPSPASSRLHGQAGKLRASSSLHGWLPFNAPDATVFKRCSCPRAAKRPAFLTLPRPHHRILHRQLPTETLEPLVGYFHSRKSGRAGSELLPTLDPATSPLFADFAARRAPRCPRSGPFCVLGVRASLPRSGCLGVVPLHPRSVDVLSLEATIASPVPCPLRLVVSL